MIPAGRRVPRPDSPPSPPRGDGPLARLLAPRSVAVVGATERPGAYGSEALLGLRRIGFAGSVTGVNPGRARAHGVPCFGSLREVPEAVDAVVVAVPAAAVADVVRDAAALGCGGAVVFAAGFEETGADALVADLPVCGPNGNGIVSVASRVAMWGDQLPAGLSPGPVALVTQSGNVAVNALASRRGLRLHTVVSCGNASPAPFVEAVAGLAGVRCVALYLEDDGGGAEWCSALEACASHGVRVVVLKAGSSREGAAAARAHTGALAGDQRVFRAFMEECGAVWARDPHELLEFAKALAADPVPSAGGVGVMTCSGGDSAVAADLAAGLSLELPGLSPRSFGSLKEVLPAEAAVANPLDYTSLLWEKPERLTAALVALAGDAGIGRVLVLYDEPAGLDGAAAASWAAVLEAISAGARATGTPVVVASTLPELLSDTTAASLCADGIPAVAGLHTGLRTLAALATPPADPERIRAIATAASALRGAIATQSAPAWLGEAEAKALFAPGEVPEGRTVATAEEAVAAARELGGRVAVKATGAHIQHKAQINALHLDPPDVHAAATQLLLLSDQVLVERLVPPGSELFIAVRTDTIVPVLVTGQGGAHAEAKDDVTIHPLPATDVPPIAHRAVAIALANDLTLLELNPVIDGVAVDAVAARRTKERVPA